MDILNYIFHILQTGFTVRSFGEDWENFEWNSDDHFEDLWRKGEAGVDLDSFSQSPLILEPDHFQSLFLIMGVKMSLGLVVLLWDILANSKIKFFTLMMSGLSACLLVTFTNLYFFSIILWTPVTSETKIRMDNKGWHARHAKILTTGDYVYDMEKLGNNKNVAFAILGYGAVLSCVFILVAMMRSLGKVFPLDNEYFIIKIQVRLTTNLPKRVREKNYNNHVTVYLVIGDRVCEGG